MLPDKATLPAGWQHIRLGAIVTLIMGQSPPGEATNTTATGLPLIGGASDYRGDSLLATRYTSAATKTCLAGDLVLCVRATIGKVALADKVYCLGRGVAGLRPIRVNGEWLRYWLVSRAEALDNAGTGSTFRQIDKQTLSEWPVDLPPLEEQALIVAKLNALFANTRKARAELAAVPKLVERYKQALLAMAFSGELTADWHTSNNAPDWQPTTLKAICRSITDGDHQAPPKASDGGIPFITIAAINDATLKVSKATRFVPPSYYANLSPQRQAQRGDILYSVTGSIAIPALVDTDEAFVFQRHIAILKPDNNIVNSKYLYYSLQDEAIKQQANEVATGTAQLTIPLGGLRNFRLALPSLAEQTEIVTRIETAFKRIERLGAEAKRSLALLDRLEAATLAHAFGGRLL